MHRDAPQSVTQHLHVLEAAKLVTVARRGRERLHDLNPVPLHDMQERWIDKFERPRLRTLSAVKRRAEGRRRDRRPQRCLRDVHREHRERVWDALVDADLTARYSGQSNVSSSAPGARWEHVRTDGAGVADVVGTVLDAERPHRLVLTFEAPDGSHEPSRVTFTIEPHADLVRLTVTPGGLADPAHREAAILGWSSVCANLKTLLETGDVMPQPRWEMHAALGDELMARNDPR